VNSLRGMAGLIGPGMFTWVFSLSIGTKPLIPLAGSPFYLAAGLLLVGLVVAAGMLLRGQGEAVAA